MLKFFCGLLSLLTLNAAASAASINAPDAQLSEAALTARGVLRAGQTAEISAAMFGRLLEAGYKPGQYFKSGARLAVFDCSRQEAELTAITRAQSTLALKHKNTTELFSLGAAGELEVALELSIIVPSKWMRWIDIGQRFNFAVDETGESFTAKIIRRGAAVDPVSQTIDITAKPLGDIKALTGMSGIARFETPSQPP